MQKFLSYKKVKGQKENSMNKNDYEEMIEIPVETTSITVKPNKKRAKSQKKIEKLDNEKEKLVNKINDTLEEKIIAEVDEVLEPTLEEGVEEITEDISSVKIKKKKRFFNVITVELGVIVVLCLTIVFSNVFFENTFINSFFYENEKQSLLTDKEYSTFEVNLPYEASSMTLTGGELTIDGTGSIYAPCNGVISSITEELGKYVIEISHSNSFKTVLKGVDYAYFGLNEKVYANLPIGYSNGEGVSLCFYNDTEMITNYDVADFGIVWLV